MKNILIALFMAAGIFIACCQSLQKTKDVATKIPVISGDSSSIDTNMGQVKPSFTVNPQTAAQFSLIIQKYLDLKNSLADDDENKAKDKGKELLDALSGLDKSLLTKEQKKIFEPEENELKEDA